MENAIEPEGASKDLHHDGQYNWFDAGGKFMEPQQSCPRTDKAHKISQPTFRLMMRKVRQKPAVT